MPRSVQMIWANWCQWCCIIRALEHLVSMVPRCGREQLLICAGRVGNFPKLLFEMLNSFIEARHRVVHRARTASMLPAKVGHGLREVQKGETFLHLAVEMPQGLQAQSRRQALVEHFEAGRISGTTRRPKANVSLGNDSRQHQWLECAFQLIRPHCVFHSGFACGLKIFVQCVEALARRFLTISFQLGNGTGLP